MRAPTILVVLSLTAVIAPTSSGQNNFEELATDSEGDVVIAGQTTAPSPASDLIELRATENGTHLIFIVEMANFADQSTPVKDNALVHVHYEYHQAAYRLVLERRITIDSAEPSYSASLQLQNSVTREYDAVDVDIPIEADEASATMTTAVRYAAIEGASGFPAAAGQSLTGIYVQSTHDLEPGSGALASNEPTLPNDRMPDTGLVEYTLKQAVTEGASFTATLPTPVRFTNGGSSTYAFPIVVASGQPEPLELIFSTKGAPANWNIDFTNPIIELQPNGEAQNLLVVRAQFAHEHGGEETIQVRVETSDGTSAVDLEARIAFTDIPQPAGHHSRLWLHTTEDATTIPRPILEATGSSAASPFMNAMKEDERDTNQVVNIQSIEGGLGWVIPLDPGLSIGLDFEDDLPGEYELRFAPNLPAPVEDFSIEGHILVGPEGALVRVADLESQSVGTLSAEQTVIGAIRPTPEGDLVSFQPGSNMLLVVVAQFSGANAAAPVNPPDLLPGGELELPLLEYQDPVPLVPNANIVLAQPDIREANPGRLTSVPIELRNEANQYLVVTLGVLGADDQWMVSLDRDEIALPAKESRTVNAILKVPADASHGTILRFLMTAQDDVAGVTSVVPVTVLVNDREDIASATLDAPEEDSPGLGPIFLMLFMAVAAMATRTKPRNTAD